MLKTVFFCRGRNLSDPFGDILIWFSQLRVILENNKILLEDHDSVRREEVRVINNSQFMRNR